MTAYKIAVIPGDGIGRGGAGLGLAVVERVARAHGGRLELALRPGGGLAARFILETFA